MLPPGRTKLLIKYKSGQEVAVTCDSFKITSVSGEITVVEWDNVRPKPLHIGIGNIESVWEL